MAISLRRRGKKTNFAKAADGSMSLMDHLRELRGRLFKASIGIVVGLIAGYTVAQPVLAFLNAPYCDFMQSQDGALADPNWKCEFNLGSPMQGFILDLRVALVIGVIISAPVWLYQMWAFIAPGLHKNERRYTYYFAAVAGPLFIAGAILAHFVIGKSLEFFIPTAYDVVVNMSDYFDFVTGVMLLFGAGFEFPLVIVLMNVIGIASAKKLLSWWRVTVFLIFLFCAVVTPSPDPFGMTALALAMCVLYFAAVGFAFLNDKRRSRKNADWDNIDPDQASDIDEVAPVAEPEAVADPDPLAEPSEIDEPGRDRRRYDDDAT
ncbi:twin-arginine translocase subunit TatC [Stackebrandtia soli]|uniref:twin-arginine translocase subunit TatC n=1 Tax=Stackebrandtia soli TaxID=1892856 RepID=UPI0039ED62D3